VKTIRCGSCKFFPRN